MGMLVFRRPLETIDLSLLVLCCDCLNFLVLYALSLVTVVVTPMKMI